METNKEAIIEWTVEGMNCSSCANTITNYLKKNGFEHIYVNFATKEVRFASTQQAIDIDAVKKGIHRLGYQVVELEEKTTPFWTIQKQIIFALILTLPLIINHFFHVAGIGISFLEIDWVQWAMSTPVYILGAWRFGRSAIQSLRNGAPNMDVLIFIGSTSAYIYSLYGLVMHEPAYSFFETAASIICFVLIGNWIEERSVQKTLASIDALQALKVETAKKILMDNIVETPIHELCIGDILIVNEGDSVPTDGEILSGNGTMNESMLSGEVLPVEKNKGDKVFAGSILQAGNFRMRADALGKDTLLQQIIELVKQAQTDKPAIQRLADKISEWFVPAVILIALATALLSYFAFNLSFVQSVLRAIAVLTISCPCAMGLATPTAVAVGVGRAAREGILIRGASALETVAKMRYLILDKTGTLTTGDFQIKDIDYLGGDEQTIQNMMFDLENSSSHPIAQSLVKALQNTLPAEKRKRIFTKIKENKGLGMTASTEDGTQYSIGSHKLLNGIENVPSQKHDLYLIAEKNNEKKIIAAIRIADELRPDAAQTIAYFKEKAINIVVLSGDHHEKVKNVCETLGIAHFYADTKPSEKWKIIKNFQQKGITTMVGDGINDAPALVRADIGISLGGASPAAIQSAQIILLQNKLSSLQKLHRISILTLQTIKENLFWAFAYNLVAIPIAALGYLNPMWAALFMAFSDVIVIGNSLRLNRKK